MSAPWKYYISMWCAQGIFLLSVGQGFLGFLGCIISGLILACTLNSCYKSGMEKAISLTQEAIDAKLRERD